MLRNLFTCFYMFVKIALSFFFLFYGATHQNLHIMGSVYFSQLKGVYEMSSGRYAV